MMRHLWLPFLFLVLLAPFPLDQAAGSSEKEPVVTILYTANTFGKKEPCPV